MRAISESRWYMQLLGEKRTQGNADIEERDEVYVE